MRKTRMFAVLFAAVLLSGIFSSCSDNNNKPSVLAHDESVLPEITSNPDLPQPGDESKAGEQPVLIGIIIDSDTEEHAVIFQDSVIFRYSRGIIRGVDDISANGDLSIILVTTDSGVYVIDRQGNELFDASDYRKLERVRYGDGYFIAYSRFEPAKYIIDRRGRIIAGPYSVLFPVYLPDVYVVSSEHDGKYDMITIADNKLAEGIYIEDQDEIAAYIPAINTALADFEKKIGEGKESAFEELWGKARYEAAEIALSELAEGCDPGKLAGAERDAYLMRRLLASSVGEWRMYEAEELILCESYGTPFTADGGGLRMEVKAIYRNGAFIITDLYYLDY